jgi:outer membrane receptor protein involved in Fe transport
LALYPEPNLPNNQYLAPFSQPSTENYGQTRLDHAVSVNDTLFGRYTVDDGQQVTPTQGNPAFALTSLSRGQFATLSETHVFSPTVINTFRFSYSRTKIALDALQPPSGPGFSLVPGEPLGYITVGGIMDLGADRNVPILHKQNVFTWSDDVFATRGRHLLKAGILVNRFQQYLETNSYVRGGVGFANLRSLLLAQPTFYLAVTPGSIVTRSYRYTTFGFYLQDDFRVSPSFTLNLGLRYEFNTQIRENRGIEAAIRDIQHDAEPTLGPMMENSSLRNFSPRIGFAWDVTGNGRTAVRGGF